MPSGGHSAFCVECAVKSWRAVLKYIGVIVSHSPLFLHTGHAFESLRCAIGVLSQVVSTSAVFSQVYNGHFSLDLVSK